MMSKLRPSCVGKTQITVKYIHLFVIRIFLSDQNPIDFNKTKKDN
jgi:hypothetical protein